MGCLAQVPYSRLFWTFLGLYNGLIVNTIVSPSDTLVNDETRSKPTISCFLFKFIFLTSLLKRSVDLKKYVSGFYNSIMSQKNLASW